MSKDHEKALAVSPAKQEANRKNALKSTGPKTPEGKAKIRLNALKHGLLASEAVILDGDGKEDPDRCQALLDALVTAAAPQGPVEEMLVERIAVCYWRLCRACRCEIGLLRADLDSYQAAFYEEKDWQGSRLHYTDAEIAQQIAEHQERIRFWKEDKVKFNAMMKAGKSLEETYGWEENWDYLFQRVVDDLEAAGQEAEQLGTPQQIHQALKSALGWSDADIWQALLAACDDGIVDDRAEITKHQQEMVKNALALEVVRLRQSIPASEDMDRLLRYETAIERQLYRALAQLERLQRQRRGEPVPPPLQVEVNGEK